MASHRANRNKVQESFKQLSIHSPTPRMPRTPSRALIPNPTDAAAFVRVFKELSRRAIGLPAGSEAHREVMKEVIDIAEIAMNCVKNLSDTLEALNGRISELDIAEAQFKYLQKENEELKDREQNLEEEVQAGEEHLVQLRKENNDLKGEAQRLGEQIQTLRSANALLLTENFTYELEKAAAAGTPEGGHNKPLVRRSIILSMLPANMNTAMLSQIVRGGKIEYMHVYSSESESGHRSAIVSFLSEEPALNFHEWVISPPALTIRGVKIRSELTLTNPASPTGEDETRALEVRVPKGFSGLDAKEYMTSFAKYHNLYICIQSVQTMPHNGATVARFVFEGKAMATRILKTLQSQGLKHTDAAYSYDECEEMLRGKKAWGFKPKTK